MEIIFRKGVIDTEIDKFGGSVFAFKSTPDLKLSCGIPFTIYKLVFTQTVIAKFYRLSVLKDSARIADQPIERLCNSRSNGAGSFLATAFAAIHIRDL
ncbi:MAG: hypothetical protein WBA51_20065 [Erythrobacter sp.]